MRLYLSTPILRELVRRLNTLDNKLAETIIKVDCFIKASPSLREVFGNDIGDDLRSVKPFLREDLIKKTLKKTKDIEDHRRTLPGFHCTSDVGFFDVLEDLKSKHCDKGLP